MIPEEHLPAVDDCCLRIIHVAHYTNATVPEMVKWIREHMKTAYAYEKVE